MSLLIYHVDAFSDRPFGGNPAAVCLVETARDAGWMQHLALEMNLSETAFLEPRGDHWSLRWFTPGAEVDLCGHATLASAHVLWTEGLASPDEPLAFETRSGRLGAERNGDLIELDFPAEPPEACDPPAPLLEALDVAPAFVGRNRMDLLVEVADEATLRGLRPDFRRLAELGARGVMVTSRPGSPATADCDFVSRYFAPAFGIDEDPVTGSAHCCLGPFWGERLGRDTLVARQISPRGGLLEVTMRGDRVRLGGRAVTVLRGRLTEEAVTGTDPIRTG
jgi:PhzF family phenazine biosynthesis protein